MRIRLIIWRMVELLGSEILEICELETLLILFFCFSFPRDLLEYWFLLIING